MHFIWGLVNALQMVTYTVIFELYHPAAVKDFQLTLIGFCTADLFPTEGAFNFIFSFVETENYNESLAAADYEGANFV